VWDYTGIERLIGHTWDRKLSLSLQESRVCLDELLRLHNHLISIIPSTEVIPTPSRLLIYMYVFGIRVCFLFRLKVRVCCLFVDDTEVRLRDCSSTLQPRNLYWVPTSTSRTETPPVILAVCEVEGGVVGIIDLRLVVR
jgi:hypothetical protein